MKPNARPDTKEEARVYLTLDRAAHHPGLNPTALRQLIATGELQADAGLSISHPLYLEARTLLSQGRITVGLTGFEHVPVACGEWLPDWPVRTVQPCQLGIVEAATQGRRGQTHPIPDILSGTNLARHTGILEAKGGAVTDPASRLERHAEHAVPLSVPDSDLEEHTGGGNTRGTRQRFGSVRKLPSGRLQARYTGPDGQEHRAPITFDTKGDAQTWLAMQSAAITESRWKPAPPPKEPLPSFGTYADEWLDRRDLKPRTRSEYKRVLTGLKETFGDVVLDDITAAQVRSWHQAYGTTRKTARVHAYSLLRTILNAAVDEELLADNPCHIRGAGVHRSSRPIRPATLAELETIANAMPPRYRLMVHLATWCALRFGELTELRRHDVVLARPSPDADATEGLLHVRRAVAWVKDDEDKAQAIVGTPKSDAGVRDVAIPPHLIPMLDAHLAEFAQPGAKGLLFPNTDGHHMHHGSLYKVYRPARRAAGREDLRWHDLRHTGATMAAQAGATTRELMTRLGHTTVGVAMRYQHAAADRDAEIARRLSRMVRPLA